MLLQCTIKVTMNKELLKKYDEIHFRWTIAKDRHYKKGLKDSYIFGRLLSSFNSYKVRALEIDKINEETNGKKIRHENFPSDISG